MQDNNDDAFELPLQGLFADLDAGVGSVHLPGTFHDAPAAVQLRVLADWQRALAVCQQQALRALYDEVAREAPALPPHALAQRVAQACRALGLRAPLHAAVPLPASGRSRDFAPSGY